MAKGKSKKKGKGVGTKGVVGAGVLGGVASLIATKTAGEAVKEVVRYGAGQLLDLRRAPPALEKDLGYKLLKLLAKRREPVRLASLPGELDCGLLSLLDAVKALRKVGLVKFGDGRRFVLLTAPGREALETLSPRPKDKAKKKDQPDDEGEAAGDLDLRPVGAEAEAEPATTGAADSDDRE